MTFVPHCDSTRPSWSLKLDDNQRGRLNSCLEGLDALLREIVDANFQSAFADNVSYTTLRSRHIPDGLPPNISLSFMMSKMFWFPESFGMVCSI
jgi:hypothetical protein